MSLLAEKTPSRSGQASSRAHAPSHLEMGRVATIILGGGEGTRLFPLNETRCKPAIFFGGRYRLVDVPISNAIHSGCYRIFILTQYLSSSLHKHILKAYPPTVLQHGCIELLPAEHKPSQQEWFQGTADAIRHNLEYFHEIPADYFLILSGDQLYHMDYRKMVSFAKESGAELVVATLPVDEVDAKRFGLLKINQDSFVTDFCEKPQEKKLLEPMRLDTEALKALAISPDSPRQFLGSMGIYLFKREALFDLLKNDPRDDFGKHLIPTKVKDGTVAAFLHDGYWEDIGTIGSYYKANLSLTQPNPEFNLYDEASPIFTYRSHLPAPKIFNTHISHSIICEGSVIEAKEIKNSILGPRSVVKKGTVIHNTYVIGNEYYNPPMPTDHLPDKLEIGKNVVIQNAIIDKEVHLGDGVRLVNEKQRQSYDSDNVYIRDGIIIVTRGASIPDGYTL